MQVRLITENDIEALIDVARAMHAESPIYSVYPFRDHSMRTWFYAALERPEHYLCAVAEQDGEIAGVVLACAMPMIFADTMMGGDLGFYVAEKYRGSRAATLLEDAYDNWARDRGCLTIDTSVSVGINNEQAVSFFKKKGFKEIGVLLRKELAHV